ncbi:MAG: hypothetical protein R3E87_26560 [Burkholderiaceae bacterium]
MICAAVLSGNALADQKAAGAGTIYRCDMPDGRVVFTDSRCTGAAKAATWRPRTILPGLHIKPAEPRLEPLMAEQQPGPTLAVKAEPYADCQARGGQYRVASKLCILPSRTTQNH